VCGLSTTYGGTEVSYYLLDRRISVLLVLYYDRRRGISAHKLYISTYSFSFSTPSFSLQKERKNPPSSLWNVVVSSHTPQE
jgi:hypothetical protein